MIAIEKQVVFFRRNNWLNNRFYSHQVTVMVALPVVTLFYVSYSVHSVRREQIFITKCVRQ